MVTSLQVAEYYGKRHADVMRAIRQIIQDDENDGIFDGRKFALVDYTDAKGERRPAGAAIAPSPCAPARFPAIAMPGGAPGLKAGTA